MKLNFLDPISSNSVLVTQTIQGLISIGRRPNCDVVIPNRYSSVSSCHASIRSIGDITEIIDGDGIKPSTNGIFIDGLKIVSGKWHSLKPGMTLSLGNYEQATSITLLLGVQSVMPTSSSSRSIPVQKAPQQQVTTENMKAKKFSLESSEVLIKSLLATWYIGAGGLNNQTGQIIMTNQRLVFCARNRWITATITGPILDMILRSEKIRWQITVGDIEYITSFKRLGIKRIYRVKSLRWVGEEFVFVFNPGAGSSFEDWAEKIGYPVTKEGSLG